MVLTRSKVRSKICQHGLALVLCIRCSRGKIFHRSYLKLENSYDKQSNHCKECKKPQIDEDVDNQDNQS